MLTTIILDIKYTTSLSVLGILGKFWVLFLEYVYWYNTCTKKNPASRKRGGLESRNSGYIIFGHSESPESVLNWVKLHDCHR